MKRMKLATKNVKLNDYNPRSINDKQFKKLIASIKEFPEMLGFRPIVVDEDNVILGGNMRFQACVKSGLKEVNVIQVTGWSEERKKEFIIKDNAHYGEWDYDILANRFDEGKLNYFGMQVWNPADAEFSENDEPLKLDDDSVENKSEATTKDFRAIQLEFTLTDYDEAKELITSLRGVNAPISSIFFYALQKLLSNETQAS